VRFCAAAWTCFIGGMKCRLLETSPDSQPVTSPASAARRCLETDADSHTTAITSSATTTLDFIASSRLSTQHVYNEQRQIVPSAVKLEFHGTDTDTNTDTDFRDAPIV